MPAVSTSRTGTPSMSDALLDRVARRSGNLRNDRAVFAEQRVEQRRLSGVRRPDDRDGTPSRISRPISPSCRSRSKRNRERHEPLFERVRGRARAPRRENRSRRPALRASRRASARSARTSSARAPPRFASAARAAERVSASMTSATAAAACKSIFPLRKARRVNSPGSARRAPQASSARTTSRATTGEP